MTEIAPLDSISITWYGTLCNSRCRHCLLENTGKQTSISYARAKSIVKRFIDWSIECESISVPITFVAGYSCDFPEIIDYIEFGKRYGMYWAEFLPLNGIAFRNLAEFEALLQNLKNAGLSTVGLTFFGTSESHDKWARRKGDYDFLLLVAETAAKCGLQRQETLFLTRDSLQSMAELISTLDAIPNLAGRSVSFWDYRGFGKRLDHERLTSDHVRTLTEQVRQYINLETYKPESDWIRWLMAGNIPEKKRRNYQVSLWEQNIEAIENMSCDEIIEQLRLQDEQFVRAIPSVSQLAERFGHRWGNRLYALRDLEWKWIDCYLDEYPEIVKIGRFSDLDSCIMWK